MTKIDGRKIARGILSELKKLPAPGKKLAVILAGDNRASLAFIGVKQKLAAELGVKFELRALGAAVGQKQLENEIEKIGNREDVGGVVVQLPLPKGLNRDAALRRLNPQKDVDNLTGKAPVEAPAALVVKDVLDSLPKRREFKKFKNLKDLTVAVVGRGFLVGEPVVKWLEEHRASLRGSASWRRRSNLSVCEDCFSRPARGRDRNDGMIIKTADIGTKNLKKFLADADLIISGVGKKDLINPEWLKEGAGVIDFGYPPDLQKNAALPAASCNDEDGVIASPENEEIASVASLLRNDKEDVIASPEGAKQSLQRLSFYTPTPGGTGPILAAELFKNFYKLSAKLSA